MRESSKTALGGIVAALSTVIMLITYISPVLAYTAPCMAGLLLLLIVIEINYGWAIGTYLAISALSVFFIADKEAAVFFFFFFGYYPILGYFLNQKIHNRGVLALIKFSVFNLAVIGAAVVSAYVFSIDYSEFSKGALYLILSFFLPMNFLFVSYDFLLKKLIIFYKVRIQKKFRKLFRR